MFKRLLSGILVALLLCAFAASAEEAPVSFDAYAGALEAQAGTAWKEDGSAELQTLALGGVSVYACLRGEVLVALTVESPREGDFGEDVRAALEPLGWFDEAALSSLFEMSAGSEAVANGYAYGKIEGETRSAVWLCPEAERDALVWQPVHGGTKYHAKSSCSGMDVPRLVTVEAAEAAGFAPCGRCVK